MGKSPRNATKFIFDRLLEEGKVEIYASATETIEVDGEKHSDEERRTVCVITHENKGAEKIVDRFFRIIFSKEFYIPPIDIGEGVFMDIFETLRTNKAWHLTLFKGKLRNFTSLQIAPGLPPDAKD